MTLTYETILLFLAVMTAVGGVWWKVESKIDKAKDRAESVAEDFGRYKTHVAETYITKQGLKEATDQIMVGVNAIKSSVDYLTDRFDRWVEKRVGDEA